MTARRWNATVRWVMAIALLITGAPLLMALRPTGPLQVRPDAVDSAELTTVPGEIVVDAKDSLTDAQLADLERRYGVDLRYNSVASAADKVLVADVDPNTEESLLAALAKDPLVESASELHVVKGLWTPNDRRFNEQWNMKMVGAEKAWDKARGKGVIVAVIDTGVAFENDDKCYRAKDFGETQFVPGYDFVNDDPHPNDDHGHGTHVSGTIAESTNNEEGVAGLAFEAKIMPIKVLDSFGSGSSADIANAVRWAADHGAQVINMSLGGPHPDPAMRNACAYAAKKGVLVVCAAGNSGGGRVGYPAAFPECLAVSAVGPSGNLASYSSIGKEVAIAAPGGETERGAKPENGVLQNTVIYTPDRNDDYQSWNGTSMASPHVAAAAALVMSMGVKDAAQVKQILQKSATRKTPAVKYGSGLLSASKAVDAAGNARRDSTLMLIFSLIAGATGMGFGAIRSRVGLLARFPFAPIGFLMGALGPDLLFGWLGFGSPVNLLLHSALIPLYLLWEAGSRSVYRFVSAMAIGMACHLGFDAFAGQAPFPNVLPEHATPWLWVNVLVGVGVALVAWRRSVLADS
jgi:serine protease